MIEKYGCELILNLDKLHTTELGAKRIIKNLSLDTEDAVAWCREKIQAPETVIFRKGKNWYADTENCEITVNAYSYTIITAHKRPVAASISVPDFAGDI